MMTSRHKKVGPAVPIHIYAHCGLHARHAVKTWAICTRRAGKLSKARSRLYRSQILQVNTHVKAVAEISTIHSFAPLGIEVEKKTEKPPRGPKKTTTKKGGNKKRDNRKSRKQKKNY